MKRINLINQIKFAFIFIMFSVNSQISFEESGSVLGIDTSYGLGEFGGGVSFYDYNGDGWDDITVSSGAGNPIHFYKNVNGLFVVDDIIISNSNFETKQVQWVDFDNDDDMDLFITGQNDQNKLYQNDGKFNFIDITSLSGLNLMATNSWGASWGDFNNDGYLDVYVCFRNFGDTQPNALFKNLGDGTFVNVSFEAGLNQMVDPTFCAAFFDYNNDGWQDIFVTNHKFSQSYLYKNNGNETFTDVSSISGADILADGMSTTIGDFNNDGWFDIYVTNNPPGNYHLMNNGNGTFTNVASSIGTGFYSVAWGAVFLDADNDSDLDLYVSGMLDGTTTLPSAFYENLDNNSFSIPENIGFENDTAQSFSNAIGDIDNDGLPDIFVVNQNRNNFLWKNTSNNSNNWLKINLEGVVSNKDGIGCKIELYSNEKTQYRYTLNGEGYIAQNSKSEFFGIGTATNIVFVKVTWLSGIVDILYNIDANQEITIIEGGNILSTNNIRISNFNIFPNPSKGVFNIEMNNLNFNEKLSVFDVFGRKVTADYFLNDKLTLIDLNNLVSGIYFLKISSIKGVFTKKIILQ